MVGGLSEPMTQHGVREKGSPWASRDLGECLRVRLNLYFAPGKAKSDHEDGRINIRK